jgi:hypothetical protein
MDDKIVELPNEIIHMIMEQLYRLNKTAVLNDLKSLTRNVNHILNYTTHAEEFKYTRVGESWMMTWSKFGTQSAISYYKFEIRSPLDVDYD